MEQPNNVSEIVTPSLVPELKSPPDGLSVKVGTVFMIFVRSFNFYFLNLSSPRFLKIDKRCRSQEIQNCLATPSLKNACQPVKTIRRKRKSLIRVRQMRSAFHSHAQRNAFRYRDVRQQ